MTSSLYYIQFNKCICNLTSEYSFNCGFKIFFDLSDEVYTQVVYITYNMGNRDLPDIYAHALGPAALGLGPPGIKGEKEWKVNKDEKEILVLQDQAVMPEIEDNEE